jgi:ATP-binding cassette, subfamily C, bacterial exporter for protease/lipase
MSAPPAMTPGNKIGGKNPIAEILWTFRRELAFVALLSFVSNLLMLSPTLYMLQIFDRVLSSRSELTLLMVSLIILMFFAVMAFADWVRGRLLVRAGVRFDEALNNRLFHAGFRAELEQSGESAPRVFTDLTNIRQFLTGRGTIAIFDAPWTPIYILVAFVLHPYLGWLSILFVTNLVVLGLLGKRASFRTTQAVSDAEVGSNAFLYSKLRNSEVIEAMGMLGSLRERWITRHRQLMGAQEKAEAVTERASTLVKFVRRTQQSLALAVAAWLTIRGELSLGSMIAANLLVARASLPIEAIITMWSSFLSARESFDRLTSTLRAHPEPPAGQRTDAPTGAVALRGLVATAPMREEPILKGIDREFPAGQCTAIIGPSGSGKSTLARALLGIWPFIDGEVLLDGVPIESWSRAALGRAIGYLPQDVELFDGTIAENIARFGAQNSDAVIEAAGRAGMHDMILRLPAGYDTPIGEAGSVLSAGQRQRIALARALYGNPRLVVLDEPNANLDDAGDFALYKAVEEMKARGATVFIITHRTNILKLADRVLVLDRGTVQADGSREAVFATLPRREPPPGGPAMFPQPA